MNNTTAFPTQNFLNDLNEALTEFGSYTFEDKGPHEVMDLDKYERAFKSFTPEEAVEVIVSVLETPVDKPATPSRVSYALSAVALDVFDTDDITTEEWDKLYNSNPVSKAFFDEWF